MKVKVYYGATKEIEVDDKYKALIPWETFTEELADELEDNVRDILKAGAGEVEEVYAVHSENDEVIFEY